MSDNAPPVELPDDILNLSHFTLKATLFIEPARLDEFMGHFKKCFDEITSRPECEFFEVYTSPQREPGVVQFVEDWYVTLCPFIVYNSDGLRLIVRMMI